MAYDVIIVGCGITGAALAYELSRFKVRVAVLEKSDDVAAGATRANSAVLHAGFDPIPGSAEAALNLEGIRLAKELCDRLGVRRREIPTLVIAFTEREIRELEMLLARGEKNGVRGIRIMGREDALTLEPALNPAVTAALYAPGSAIVDPWDYTLALAETAVRNGVDVRLRTRVCAITGSEGNFALETSRGTYNARYVVNAAGSDSDKVHEMVGGSGFTSTHFKGSYYVLDRTQGAAVNSIIFPCPDEHGFKGILVAPTIFGTLICGPDAVQVRDGSQVGTCAEDLAGIKAGALRSVPGLDFSRTIRQYAGVRPNTEIRDFIIGESPVCKGFINLAGIKSPGLSAAPAIAKKGIGCLRDSGLELQPREAFTDSRSVVRVRDLPHEEIHALVRRNPLYGRVICRCELVTQGEIVDAIHRPIPPLSVGAVKRRTGAGMGRCQGSYCGPRILSILSRETGLQPEAFLPEEEAAHMPASRQEEERAHV